MAHKISPFEFEAKVATVRALFKEAGRSQAGMAKSLGVSERTVRRWERGDAKPTGGRLKQTVDKLNRRIEYYEKEVPRKKAEDELGVKAKEEPEGEEEKEEEEQEQGTPHRSIGIPFGFTADSPASERFEAGDATRWELL